MEEKTLYCCLFLIGILSASYAAPTTSGRCASECIPAANPKFNYAQGKVYSYNYESETTLSALGGIKETPGYKISATAEFHAVSPCEFVLKLTNAKLGGSLPIPNAGDFKKSLEDKTIVFSHSDGRVDNVCADPSDPPWVVNYKRAIISTFQNSIDNQLETHVREVDVIGQCNTHYTIDGNTITKIKDVISCTNRVGNISALQADHYPSYSEIQSVPLLESTYKCTHTIGDSITKAVDCEETHRYRPYAKGDKTVYAKTHNKLTYTKNAKSGIRIPPKFVRTTLLFDHDDENAIVADTQDTNKVLKKLCDNYAAVEIGEDASHQFTRLLYLVRRLSSAQLNTILQSLPTLCPASTNKLRDTYLSALAGAGTEDAASVLYESTKTSPVNKARLRLWALSFAFIKKPTIGFVTLLSNFVSETKFDTAIELSSSTIVHGYCRHHTDCQNEAAVQKIISFFGNRLSGKCVGGTESDEDQIISALKSLGNIGHVGQFAPAILECIKNPAVHVPIRLAAVNSFRRIGTGDEQIGRKLYEVLKDVAQDTEVRIAIYVILARHPSTLFYSHLSELLEHETVNQVSSFIWSHIRNLKESNSPVKREIHKLADDIQLQRKFHNDVRKYSRNYDASFFSEKYNVGADLETNVVFTPESFLPRSTTFNFTVDFFGSAINVFELTLRAEHFEYLLEKYFGPAGKIATTDKKELYKQYKDRWHSIAEGIENQAGTDGHRHKRELPYKAQKLREVQDKSGLKAINQPEGSVSLKVFGNELIYRHFHRLNEVYDKDEPFHIQDILNKMAQHKEVDIARNWMILDATYSVPTASGIPLRLDLNLTLSVGLKLNSHFDVRKFLLRPRGCDIKSFIQPSANLEDSGALILDAHVSKTGIKVDGNAYTALAVDATFQVKEGESLIANLDLPTPVQKIFEFDSKVYLVQNDVDVPATLLNPGSYDIERCTPGKSGLQLCSHMVLPKPLFNENRPYWAADYKYYLLLKKKDAGLQGFHFTALWKREKGAGEEVKNTELKLSVDTPGSAIPREYTLDYQLNREANVLRINLRSPKFKIGLNGNYVNEATKKEANLKLNINDEREYGISGKANVNVQGNTRTYNGAWEITHTGGAPVKIAGKIIRTVGKKIEFDIKSDSNKFVLKGFAQREGPLDPRENFVASCDLQVELPILKTKIVGSFENNNEEFENKHKLDLNVDYNLQADGQKRNFHVKTNCETRLDREAHEFKVRRDIEFKSTSFPQCNIQTKLFIENINQEYHSLIDLKWGEDFNDANKKFFYEHIHKYKVGGRGAYEGHGVITLIYPKRHIDWKVDSKIDYQPKKSLDYDLELKYGVDKTIKLSVDLKNQTSRLANYEGEIKLEIPNRELILRDKVIEKNKGEYTGETYIQWQKGEYLTINSAYKRKEGDDTDHHEFEATVLLGTQTTPIRKYKLILHREPKKCALSGRVDRPDVSYNVDITYDHPLAGTANFDLKVKIPWIEGTVTTKRVPGDFQGKADLTTYTGRKVAGSATLKGTGINRVLKSDFKWDAGNDDTKKISINADIERLRKKSAKVKGTLSIPNLTLKGSAGYDLPAIIFNGPHNVFADFEYGPNKKIALDAKISIDRTSSGRRTSHGNVEFSSPNVDKWRLAYYTDFHNHPDERSFKGDFNVQCSKHGYYGAEIDYLRGHKKLSAAAEVKYGEGKAIRLGAGVFRDLGGHGHGYDIGGSFELKTPFPGVQDIAITLRDAFHHSYEAGHFVTDHHVRWAPGKEVGLTVEYNRIHKHGESLELTGKIEVNTPIERYRHQKLAVDINFDRNPRVLLHSSVGAEWGDNKGFENVLHYSREGAKIDTSILIDGRKINDHFYLDGKFSNDVSNDGSFHSHATFKDFDGSEEHFDGTITVTDNKKAVDFTFVIPKLAYSPITLKGAVIKSGNKKDAEFIGTWGGGKTINFKGDLTLEATGSFVGNLRVNSKELNLNDISVGFDRTIGGPKRSYRLQLNLGEDKDIELSLDVQDKADKTGTTGTGTLKINGEEFITSKIDVLDSPTTKNEFGRLLKYTVELHNPSFSFITVVGILSEKGFNPKLKICSLEGEKCVTIEALVNLDQHDPKNDQKVNNIAYAIFTVQDGPGSSRTAGFSAETTKTGSEKEGTFKIILNKEQNKFVGFAFSKKYNDDANKPDKKKSYKVILPSRTIEARFEKVYSNQGYVYSIHVLADAVNAPTKELLITTDVKKTTDNKGYSRVTKVTVKHPKLTKDLLILSNINKPTSGKLLFRQKIDIDISKDPKKKLSIELEVQDDPKFNNGHNYTFALNVKHTAVKNLDLKLSGHIGRSKESRTAGLVFNWLTKAGQQYIISFFDDVNKVDKTIHGFVHTPLRHISWDGNYQKFEDGGIPSARANLDLLYNNKVIRSAAIEYSRGPEYNIKYFVNPQDKTRLIRFHGGVIDEDTYSWTVTRIRGGQLIEDVAIYHHLNNSHLLFNKYKWRPELLNEIRDAIDTRLDPVTDTLTEIARNFFTKAGAEIADKTGNVRETIKADLAPFFLFFKEKLVAIGAELKNDWQPLKLTKLRTVLDSIFGNLVDTEEITTELETRLENAHVSISNVFTRLGELVGNLDVYADKLGDLIEHAFANLPDKIQAWRTAIRAKLPEIADRIRNILIKARDFVNNFVENEYVSKGLSKFREIWDRTLGRVSEWIGAILEGIFGSGDGSKGLYERTKDKLYEYAEGNSEAAKALKGILLAIKSIKEKIREVFADFIKAYQEYRAEVVARLTAYYDLADPDLKELVAEIKAKRDKLFEGHDDDRSLKERIRAYVDKTLGLAKEKIQLLTSTAVFDPKNGRIEYYLPLILPVDSIRQLRTEGLSLQRFIKSQKSQGSDLYKRIKRALTSGDILPPFEAHAMLIGDQHYATYDHRFFDFVGKCQYVLTTDLVDKNFSVIVNYADKQGKPEKSSIVIISDFHNIEIKSDYKVLLDEQEVELPNQIENTHIHRELHAIKVSNNKGFTVVYDIEHNLVEVNVSGWYFGRLGGLFGNYNNEPSDDFHTPDGQNLTNPTLFANSWEVSNRCVAKDNYASHATSFFGSEGYLWCHKLFSSDWSPFQTCFPYAPASHYLQACLEEVAIRKGQLEPADTACRLASAYVDACHHHNINLKLPSRCLRCTLPSGEKYSHGDIHTLKDKEVPKSADVIFILEQKECNRKILLESLDEIAKDLEKELTNAGLTNNQYGIVAFGGEGVQGHAHPHTARGQLFTDAKSVVLALKNMAFSGTKPSDAFEAVELACNYPFRAGVAKTAVLFLCDRCSEDSQSVDYWELQHHLLEHGVSLHVLTPEEITVKSKPAAAQQIIGFDAGTTFRVKDSSAKQLTGDADIRPHVTNVDDVCQKLAQELHGSVFKSDQFGAKKNVGKSVKTVFSRRVVASATPPTCQNCDCVAGPDGVPIPFCSPCTTLKPKKVSGEEESHAAPTPPPKERIRKPQTGRRS